MLYDSHLKLISNFLRIQSLESVELAKLRWQNCARNSFTKFLITYLIANKCTRVFWDIRVKGAQAGNRTENDTEQ